MKSLKNSKSLLFVILLMMMFFIGVATAEIKSFSEKSLATIEASYLDQPFILLVWSIDCLPCRQEFEMIREVKDKYLNLNLVILATESLSEFPELNNILAEHNLDQQDNWAFSLSNSHKLRFKLDPNWYGELPRAYFYDAKHKRFAVSGKLEMSQVISWYSRLNP